MPTDIYHTVQPTRSCVYIIPRSTARANSMNHPLHEPHGGRVVQNVDCELNCAAAHVRPCVRANATSETRLDARGCIALDGGAIEGERYVRIAYRCRNCRIVVARGRSGGVGRSREHGFVPTCRDESSHEPLHHTPQRTNALAALTRYVPTPVNTPG